MDWQGNVVGLAQNMPNMVRKPGRGFGLRRPVAAVAATLRMRRKAQPRQFRYSPHYRPDSADSQQIFNQYPAIRYIKRNCGGFSTSLYAALDMTLDICLSVQPHRSDAAHNVIF